MFPSHWMWVPQMCGLQRGQPPQPPMGPTQVIRGSWTEAPTGFQALLLLTFLLFSWGRQKCGLCVAWSNFEEKAVIWIFAENLSAWTGESWFEITLSGVTLALESLAACMARLVLCYQLWVLKHSCPTCCASGVCLDPNCSCQYDTFIQCSMVCNTISWFLRRRFEMLVVGPPLRLMEESESLGKGLRTWIANELSRISTCITGTNTWQTQPFYTHSEVGTFHLHDELLPSSLAIFIALHLGWQRPTK